MIDVYYCSTCRRVQEEEEGAKGIICEGCGKEMDWTEKKFPVPNIISREARRKREGGRVTIEYLESEEKKKETERKKKTLNK